MESGRWRALEDEPQGTDGAAPTAGAARPATSSGPAIDPRGRLVALVGLVAMGSQGVICILRPNTLNRRYFNIYFVMTLMDFCHLLLRKEKRLSYRLFHIRA